MDNSYHALVNFVRKLSIPKKNEAALKRLSKIDERAGDTAIDIFENGIDNAESIIALEARNILRMLQSPPKHVESVKVVQTFTETTRTIEAPVVKLNKWEQKRQDLIQVLDECQGNKALAARTLGITVKTVYNRLENMGIHIAESKPIEPVRKLEPVVVENANVFAGIRKEHVEYWFGRCKKDVEKTAVRLGITPKRLSGLLETMSVT